MIKHIGISVKRKTNRSPCHVRNIKIKCIIAQVFFIVLCKLLLVDDSIQLLINCMNRFSKEHKNIVNTLLRLITLYVSSIINLFFKCYVIIDYDALMH